ncbi:MAG: DNA repair protein RecN [Firmicutes bacterium]|nr:DNA repair protein RecN [Bacillota bacterium]
MLSELHIENFVLIEELDLPFYPGLTVITGETGTGKSILLEAIMLLSGGRGFEDQIRSGTTGAVIEGIFKINSSQRVAELLREKGLESAADESELILSRRLQINGPNRCRINGQLVTLSDLTEIGSSLMDIQSQGDHYSLLSPKQHLRILDAYAGAENFRLRSEYARFFNRYREISRQLADLTRSEQERARQLDMLAYQVNEISAAQLRADEDVELGERRNILRNAEKLAEEAARAYGLLKQGLSEVPGALDSLRQAAESVAKIARIDHSWSDATDLLDGTLAVLEDLSDRLRTYLAELNFDPAELDRLETRLALLDSLKRKYGPELADVLAYWTKAQAELAALERSEVSKSELERELASLQELLIQQALLLRANREEAARRLEQAVRDGLQDLRLSEARFEVVVSPNSDNLPTEDGLDTVEFRFSANPPEPPKLLHRVASGGELSRLLLALKGALAASEGVPILIFDEIDTGTSGRAAQAIAEKLFELSRNYQVICVTHLPQIAAMGDQHILLEKAAVGADQYPTVKVRLLDEQGRVNELARLLGGVSVSEATVQAARDLLTQAAGYKKGSESCQA